MQGDNFLGQRFVVSQVLAHHGGGWLGIATLKCLHDMPVIL